MAVDTLEIGDEAIPVVDLTFNDPLTGLNYTLPTNGVPGIVTNRFQVSVDVETDLPIYDYQVTFDPPITTTEILPADPEDPESEDQEITYSEARLSFEAADLGLETGEELEVLDLDAIQQTISQNQQISRTATSTATSINLTVQNDNSTTESYGRDEIRAASTKMVSNDEIVQSKSISGLSDEELKASANESSITTELLGSDQQLILEYVDNVFALRDVLKANKADLDDAQRQSQEQVQRGLEDDQANADAFQSQYLDTPEAQNAFENPDDFAYPEEERDEILYPQLSEIATLVKSSLLNPEDSVIDVVVEPPEEGDDPEPLPEFEPIVPPGVDPEDLDDI